MSGSDAVDPFAIVPVALLQDRHLGLVDLRVLIALRSFWNPRKPQSPVFPSLKTLGKRCGYDGPTISKSTSRLVEAGYLDRASGTGRRATRYWILDPSESSEDRLPRSDNLLPTDRLVPDDNPALVPDDNPALVPDDNTIEVTKELTTRIDLKTAFSVQPFAEVWEARLGSPSFGRIGKALKPLVDRHCMEEVMRCWILFLDREPAKYVSAENFAARFVSIQSGEYFAAQQQENIYSSMVAKIAAENRGGAR